MTLLLAVLFSILFLSALSGCSRFAPSPEPKPLETVTAQTTDGANKNPHITFITWNEDYLPTLKREVPRFEKETGIKVSWKLLSEDVVREKVLIDLASAAGQYDLVLTDVWILPEHIAAGYLEPLDPFIAKDATFDRSAFYPTFLEALSYNDKLYALPTESFGAALTYRKDLFAQYGVKVPRTIDELVAAARTLTRDTNGDGTIDLYGVAGRGRAGEEPAILVSGFAWAFGGTWFEGGAATAAEIRTKKARPAFDTSAFRKGFTVYCDLLKRYGPPASQDYTWYELVQDGREGRVAMLLYSGFNVGAVDRPDLKLHDRYAAALPARGSKGCVQEAFSMGYGINRHSKNKAAAWEFLKFIAGKAFMEDVVTNAVTSIPMQSLRESAQYRKLHPYRAPDEGYVLEENVALIDWRYMPRLPEYSVIASLLGTATSECIAGKKTPPVALKQLNAAVTKLMTQAGYYREP